jgi:hypothetical protein
LRPSRGQRERSRQRGAPEAEEFHRDSHDFLRSALTERRRKLAAQARLSSRRSEIGELEERVDRLG